MISESVKEENHSENLKQEEKTKWLVNKFIINYEVSSFIYTYIHHISHLYQIDKKGNKRRHKKYRWTEIRR